MRRVVVTGLGTVSPLGAGTELAWRRLLAGRSGLRRIEDFDTGDLPCRIGAPVPHLGGPHDDGPDADGSHGALDLDAVMSAKERRKTDIFNVYGVAAADEALADSGWKAETEKQQFRTGVLMGSGIGGLESVYNWSVKLKEAGPRKVSPFMVPAALINLVSGNISIRHGLKGPNHSVVTACATGTHAIGDAARLIALDDADVMIAGGAEGSINRLGIAGFAAARALSTGFNDDPQAASRPWDKGRDGFVMGAGAAAMVLEEYEHAKARGATIYAEVVGYGLSGDAHHITAPAPDGSGGYRAMQAAFKRAGMTPGDIDYINAHGTSTPLGDLIELGAVKRLFGADAANVTMSSTKSAVGHLLGAAGAIEAVFSVLSIRDNICPPTLNLDDPDEGCADMDLAPHSPRERTVKAALSNSFGFGGTNASLIFREV